MQKLRWCGAVVSGGWVGSSACYVVAVVGDRAGTAAVQQRQQQQQQLCLWQ